MNPDVVDRVRAVTIDDGMGGSHRDWANATETPIPGGIWYPIQASETTTEGREGRVIGWTLIYLSHHPDIVGTDRIRWQGDLYELDGEPALFEHWYTGKKVAEIILRRVEG